MRYRLSRTFPAIGLDHDPQLAGLTRMIMTAVAHPVDTAPAARDIVTEAHLVVVTTRTIVAATVRLQEPVAQSMIIHLLVDLMTHIDVIILLTHMSMAMEDLLQGTTHQGIIHQESAEDTLMTILLLVTGKLSLYCL